MREQRINRMSPLVTIRATGRSSWLLEITALCAVVGGRHPTGSVSTKSGGAALNKIVTYPPFLVASQPVPERRCTVSIFLNATATTTPETCNYAGGGDGLEVVHNRHGLALAFRLHEPALALGEGHHDVQCALLHRFRATAGAERLDIQTIRVTHPHADLLHVTRHSNVGHTVVGCDEVDSPRAGDGEQTRAGAGCAGENFQGFSNEFQRHYAPTPWATAG